MPRSTKKRTPEAAPDWAVADDACPMFVRIADHIITHHTEYSPGEVTHGVRLELENTDAVLRIGFDFPLETASEVAAFRRFLGPLGVAIVDERDIDAACERVLGADCVAVVSQNREHNEERVLAVWMAEKEDDSQDDQDIWKHDPRWQQWEKERLAREAGAK